MTSSEGELPLRLLALDGGGIRGLSELLMIKGVMHRLMIEENAARKKDGQAPLSKLPSPCDYFDLIGGTSTGGIIALMLGRLRMDVDTAIKHYDELAKVVFSDLKILGDGKFKESKLEGSIKSVVKSATGDEESPLLEGDEAGVCRTFVCAMNAHNMNANIPVLFRTYPSREIHVDCKIWEAARATSAAPTFFKRIEIGRGQPYIDGGLGRNNPSRLVLDEAKGVFGTRPIGCLVSIGTGQGKIISVKKPGIFQRMVPTGVIDALKEIVTDCEATHETMLGLFANSPNTYFRLNVEHGMQEIQLSEWERLSKVEAHTIQYMKKKEVDEKLALLVNVIRVPRAQLTIEQLISPRPPIERIESTIDRKLCPLPVPSFTGRRKFLEDMHKYFNSSDSKFQRVFVLYGLGGSGKSQIAFKFLQESQANNSFSDIFYIDATNTQTLEMDLKAITSGNVKQSVEASLRWLTNQHDGQWLLFFDNADDVHLKLKTFFPPCVFGNILITTRNRELRLYASKGSDQNIAGMDQEDATNLLLHLSQAEETDENRVLAGAIVQELHCFALAVSQAGAFIHCHSSLRNYRELYERERDNLLQNREVQDPDPYESAVYATWRLSYDKLDASARTLLQICSMLHHEGISERMFEKAAISSIQLEDSELQNEVNRLLNELGKDDMHWSSWNFLQIIKCLGSSSLIEYDTRNCTYSLHPLVQHWCGTTIGPAERRHTIKKCVLGIISLSISWTFTKEDYKYRRALLRHITHITMLLNPIEMDPFVLSHLALIYYEQGLWKDAEVLQVAVMEKRKQVLGDHHPNTLNSMGFLANIYREQGRWKDAESLEVIEMEKTKQFLGDDHPYTFVIMGNLATTYWNQGCWKDAEVLQVTVMEKRKQLLGDNHPDTLRSMTSLAATYLSQGHWQKAEMLQVEVIEKMKQVLGDDHPDTLRSMSNLAATYVGQGQWKNAQVLEMVVTEKRKQVLGDNHPDTLRSMTNLATMYYNQGHWKDAEVLQVIVIEKMKCVIGEDHPDTLTSIANLASTYTRQGRLKDAELLEVMVIEKRKLLLGENHPSTLTSMANLAAIYHIQGHWKNAEELQVVVMEKTKQVLGDNHPNTLTSMEALCATYRKQGKWKNAEVLEVAIIEKMKQVLGDNHSNTLSHMKQLATEYYNQGHWRDAEVLQVEVIEKMKQVLGDDHPDTLRSMGCLAATYWKQGLLNNAEVLEVEVMQKMRQVLGDNHIHTIMSVSNLAGTYRSQGRWKDAEVLDIEVVAKTKQVLGDDHLETLRSMGNLASTYRNLGHWKDAEMLEVEMIERMKHVLGEDHPETLMGMGNLAVTYRKQGHPEKAEALEVIVIERKHALGIS